MDLEMAVMHQGAARMFATLARATQDRLTRAAFICDAGRRAEWQAEIMRDYTLYQDGATEHARRARECMGLHDDGN